MRQAGSSHLLLAHWGQRLKACVVLLRPQEWSGEQHSVTVSHAQWQPSQAHSEQPFICASQHSHALPDVAEPE